MNEQVPSKDQVSYLLAKLCWHTCTCQNATSPSVQHGVYCVYEQARASMPTHEPCSPAPLPTHDGGRYKKEGPTHEPPAARPNLLRDETSQWEVQTQDIDGNPVVTCHTRIVGGVLCRWWGDGPAPSGVALIERAAQPPGVIQLEGECPSCRQWVVLRTDTDEAHVLPAIRCACGAHEWPPNSVQIEDSRGRLHTLRGCQPGATSTKEESHG